MKIPHFYRLNSARLLSEILQIKTEKQRGIFILQLATDLVTGIANSSYAKELILEATDFIRKKSEAGSKGGKQKSSSAKANIKQKPSKSLASSSSSTEELKPYKEIIDDLNSKGGFQFKTTKTVNEFISGRLSEGFTKEDFFKVHSTMISRWKDDVKMCQYLRPSTLYRPSHFQEYLNVKTTQTKRIQNMDGDFIEVPL